MIKCTEIQNRLMEILEGNSSSIEFEDLSTHLAECAECRELVAVYRPLFNLETESNQYVPNTLWRGIQDKLDELEEGRHLQPTLFPFRRPFFGYAFQTAVVALAIVFGIYLGASPETSATVSEDEIAEYYAGALSSTALPVDEVYQEVVGEGGN